MANPSDGNNNAGSGDTRPASAIDETTTAADSADDRSTSEHKEPSLGPACLVIVILGLASFAAFCAFGSWIMFSDQYPYAEKGISQQLIPWVQQSQLAAADKESIVQQLNALIPKLQQRTIDKEQLLRLRNCLQDNPILLWGGVQSVLAQAKNLDLSDVEQETLVRLTQRLMRMATDRQLSRNDIEFTLQPCAVVRDDKTGLEVLSDLNEKQVQSFMKRAEQLVTQSEIPNQAYDKTPAEAFKILIDAALDLNFH